TQTSFGDLSFGGFNNSGGFDSAESRFFHDSFGLFARGSANTTNGYQQGGGFAEGTYLESVLVPPQQGMLAGDPGTLVLPFHLDGTVDIDWGGAPGGASVRFQWSVSRVDADGLGSNSSTPLNMNLLWNADHLSQTINQNVTVPVPFQF